MSGEIFFYAFFNGSAMLLCVLGLWLSAIMPGIDRWSRHYFLWFFGVVTVCCVTALLELVCDRCPVPRPAVTALLILECAALTMPHPMLTVYLLHYCGEDLRTSRLFRVVAVLCVAYFILLLVAPFTGIFLYDPAINFYVRGPRYAVLLLPVWVIMLLNPMGAIRRRRKLSRKVYLSFLIAMLPIAATFLVYMFVDVYPLIDVSMTLSVLSMYGLVLSDQMEQYLEGRREIAQQQLAIAQQELEITRQELEIADQRANIMVLQMRPHFIYNTMTSIYCLCNQDPQLARQVILDFMNYLRKSFASIASSTPIPFADELEHTRAYLAVEQAQYEDRLLVDYDMPHTRFRVPPLTLQPIVENAVKHGHDPDAGSFRISIRTRQTDNGTEIVVADNGRGFDPADDGEPHIALGNIRQRLETMCGGSLTIAPGEGGGTCVTVTIPDVEATQVRHEGEPAAHAEDASLA